MIKISSLTFYYNASEKIFDNMSLTLDTNWKLGLIGRNGRGKTTFLNLLLGSYDYKGKIETDVNFDYFPFIIKDESLSAHEIAKNFIESHELWKLDREIQYLDIDIDVLNRPFRTLSKGEQTKIMLAILFTKENNFLLIDEPTNHLDANARNSVARYLRQKRGFILVSHDRNFMDICINHILVFNKKDFELQKGNFSTYWLDKNNRDNFENKKNEKLKKDIARLGQSSMRLKNWSMRVEKSKYNIRANEVRDRGYIGHKSAKIMKRAKTVEKRREKEIAEKEKLLKNVELLSSLKIRPLDNSINRILEVHNLSLCYGNKEIFSNVNFEIYSGDRLLIKGKNGSGKSSIIKVLLGKILDYKGTIYCNARKISYISQNIDDLHGTLSSYIKFNKIDETLFRTILWKLGLKREMDTRLIENYSDGEKKKILIARSLCEQANIYIWDEPLNYIDIYSRLQIEELIIEYKPTMIFIEHDIAFAEKVATKILDLDSENNS